MFLEPMLCETSDKPFSDVKYLFEPKFDGHRLLVPKIGDIVRLYTRHSNNCTHKYPELPNIPALDSKDIILDGEVVVLDREKGKLDFELVMRRFQGGSGPVVQFVAFDILHYDGEDLRSLDVMERKKFLSDVVEENAFYSVIRYVDGERKALFEAIQRHDLEGIVAKRKDSKYEGKRSKAWLKTINYKYETVEIAGYRKDEFGWLAEINGRPVGVIELGVPPKHQKAFSEVSRQLIVEETEDIVRLEPLIKAKVKFRNWTRKGFMRSPVFIDFVTEGTEKTS
ncbi:SPBc2 prophage-derived DNA ligase-like protein LigB [Caldalkalibacillus thermarum]|uniref:ATP-dependent DNA ligase n=1 Tax=Caldalkalibacillus thermarum TaxID=296745 RepID=UPI001663AC50|nr:RNA ligase family protein [Caldalkalibacillus thermarum]GGK35467.1 SPBc2 prophage-derived DNA ligase-like protein LigB [Caldalkalibacillus thermarum]